MAIKEKFIPVTKQGNDQINNELSSHLVGSLINKDIVCIIKVTAPLPGWNVIYRE